MSRRAITMLMTAVALGGCQDATLPTEGAVYRVESSGEIFHVHVLDEATIALIETRLTAPTWQGIVTAEIARGDGGFNAPWSWHMVPATVELADLTIELCDGRPSLVEADLDYWIDTVRRFCPWGGQIVERVN